MSLHTDRAFDKAQPKGAAAARTYETWVELMGLSKRELAEVAIHLAALATGEYDEAITGDRALARIREERAALKRNGLI